MVFDMLVEQLPDHVLDFADTRIAKLQDLPAIEANQMVMLPKPIAFFINCLPRAELMALDEVAFHEQVEGIVHRGSAHTVVFVFHVDVQGFHIKMVGSVVDFFQNGESLGRFALSAFVEVGRKDPFDLFDPRFCPICC